MVAPLLLFARRLRRSVGGDAVFNVMRPMYWRTVERVMRHRGLEQRFSDGRTYRLDARLFRWELDRFEPDVIGTLLRHAVPGSCVYDIGAHVGLVTLALAHRVGDGGRVYAFEPSPDNFTLLQQHLEWNGLGSVTPMNVLVGDSSRAAVEFSCRFGEFTANSLAEPQPDGRNIRLPMVAIDDLIDREAIQPADLIKIDVEGFEHAVLRGMQRLLVQRAPVIVCAIHPRQLALLGTSPAEVFVDMRRWGYRAFDLHDNEVQQAGFEEVVFRPEGRGPGPA